MKVAEILNEKYMEALKTMNASTWANIKAQPMHPAQYMYMSFEITVNDIKANGGYTGELWQEISEMHKAKLLASNSHRQYSGHVTAYWLTKKGWAHINKDHAIC